jgi:hypothetical protein
VHGGMLKLARAMGSPGKSVHNAVKKALTENEGYGKSHGMNLNRYLITTYRPRPLWSQPGCWHCGVTRCGESCTRDFISLLIFDFSDVG